MADYSDLIPLEQAAHDAHQQLLALQERFSAQGEDGVRVPPGEWTEEQHAEYDAQWRAWREAAEKSLAAQAAREDRLAAEQAVKKAVRHPELAA
ncbi:hypothetical protein [Streptomyces sp. SGAir0957]